MGGEIQTNIFTSDGRLGSQFAVIYFEVVAD
jgi:hypothetical protein